MGMDNVNVPGNPDMRNLKMVAMDAPAAINSVVLNKIPMDNTKLNTSNTNRKVAKKEVMIYRWMMRIINEKCRMQNLDFKN